MDLDAAESISAARNPNLCFDSVKLGVDGLCILCSTIYLLGKEREGVFLYDLSSLPFQPSSPLPAAITGLGEGFVGYRAIVSASCAVVLKTHPCSLIWFVYDLGSVNNLVEAGEVPTVSVRRIEFALGCQLMPGFYTKFLSSIPWEVCLTLWRQARERLVVDGRENEISACSDR